MKWEYLRAEEFDNAIHKSGGLCVMTLGCLEKHGQHLPVGTDSLMGDKIVEFASERAEVTMFPTTMWLGDVSLSHTFENAAENNKCGFIGINPKTLLIILEELCDEIARNGFTKILFINAHNENADLLSIFCRAQFYKKKHYATMWASAYDFTKQLAPGNMYEAALSDPEYFSMLTKDDLNTLKSWSDIGANEKYMDFIETTLAYGIYPKLVAADKYDAIESQNTQKITFPNELGISTCAYRTNNHPDVQCENHLPGCTKTIGDAAVKLSVDRLVKMFEYLKNDNSSVDVMEEFCLM